MRSESFELKTMQHPAALHACSSAVFFVSLKTIRAPSVAVSDWGRHAASQSQWEGGGTAGE